MTETIIQPDSAPTGVPRVADICGLDLSSPRAFADGPPHAAFDLLRVRAPVSWQDEDDKRTGVSELRSGLPTPPSPGFWTVTSYAECHAILRDAKTFSSEAGGVLMRNVDELTLLGLRMILINMDNPRHSLQRKLLSPSFTPRLIESMRAHVEDSAREIAAALARAGSDDFVGSVAVELTTRVLANLLGIPHEERGRVLAWAQISDVEGLELEDSGGAVVELMADLFDYAKHVRSNRRANPRDDLMTLLANATVDGADFSEDEFCWFYLMLIIAGTETTRYSLSGAIEALHDQGLWPAVVAGPRPIPSAAVDELVRYVSPVMHLRRTATRGADLAGQHIRAGDKVVMWLGAANRDPAVFDDPHKLVLCRDPNPHIAFGYGVHFCLGTRLARLQLSTMLSELATQCPNLKVVAPPQRMLSTFLHALESLPVTV